MGRSRDSQHPATTHSVGSHRAGNRRTGSRPGGVPTDRPSAGSRPTTPLAPGAGSRYFSAEPGGASLAGRFTLRAVAVLLLMLGLAGGAYLGQDRQLRPASLTVADAQAEAAELRMLDERLEQHVRAEQERLAEVREKAERKAKAEAEEAARAREAEEAASRQQAESRAEPSEPVGPIPESCDEYSGNRAIGCALMLDAGFELDEMPCLDELWTHESGWNELAQNGGSGAYGIPQALPGDKMAAFGDDWQTNPATQIRWGLSYIEGRYGSPCGAWEYFENNGYY